MLEKTKLEIIKFYRQNKRMPSYSEIMKLFNYKSKNSVFKLVKKLKNHNFLKQDEKGRLIPKNLFTNLKVLGQISAGFPSLAEEELIDTMSLDEFLVKNQEATYMLKVDGDSMKEAGILAGDMVLVDRSLNPVDGDIVIAAVDGQWTIKYLKKKGKEVYLKSANKKYKDIYASEEIKIAAVVKAVIRKY
jgi:SOS regulatory protein LexA